MSDTTTGERPPIPDRPLLQRRQSLAAAAEERDLAAIVAGINDLEVGGLAGYKAPMSLEQVKGWLEHNNEKAARRVPFYAVCEFGDDRFIGTVWLKDVDYWHGSAELAIFMDRDHIGAGLEPMPSASCCASHSPPGLNWVWLTAYHRTRARHPLLREARV